MPKFKIGDTVVRSGCVYEYCVRDAFRATRFDNYEYLLDNDTHWYQESELRLVKKENLTIEHKNRRMSMNSNDELEGELKRLTAKLTDEEVSSLAVLADGNRSFTSKLAELAEQKIDKPILDKQDYSQALDLLTVARLALQSINEASYELLAIDQLMEDLFDLQSSLGKVKIRYFDGHIE